MNSVCAQIHQLAWRLKRHRLPFDSAELAGNGVYFLFEKGERAHGADRIVRIGSHRGPGNLAQRVNEHFLVPNKDRSIFRKNIGRALLNRENDRFLEQWEWDLTGRANRQRYEGRVDPDKLRRVERRITQYITANCSFAVLPTTQNRAARLALEAGLIATVAQCPCCDPSSGWLGRFSPKRTISRTGLWQTQHVAGRPFPVFPAAGLLAHG